MNNSKELTKYIKVKKVDAQFLLDFLKKKLETKKIFDNKKRILAESEFLLFPLLENESYLKELLENIRDKLNFKIIYRGDFIPSYDNSQSLKSILKEKLPPKVFRLIPNSYDTIGKIAIIEFSRFHNLKSSKIRKYKMLFAKSLMEINNSIESVYEKRSEIKGKFRLRKLKLINGKNTSETIHKENHCIFKLDIKKAFFSPRLVYERKRLSSYEFKEKEIIVDMFAGIGPFSIQIAKNHRVNIYSFDINPYAYKYLKQNIKLNNLKGQIFPYNLDVKNLVKRTNKVGVLLENKVDRLIMNLPEKSLSYIDIMCFLIKPTGGILHIYQFSERINSIDNAIDTLSISLNKHSWNIDKIINSRVVKAYSPKLDLIVIDCMVKPKC